MAQHLLDAEGEFLIVNVPPDFCKVAKAIVPFDIFQTADKEHADYSPDVVSRGGNKVIKVASVVAGVLGHLGQGVLSGVGGAAAFSMAEKGAETVLVNGLAIMRHLDQFKMNLPG